MSLHVPAAPVRGESPRLGRRGELPSAPPTDGRRQARALTALPSGTAAFYIALAGIGLLLAGLSVLLPSTPSYDPWAWLGWGREITHLSLHTTGGPSWKPLPVLFTTLFAPLGSAQPDLWLVVARAGTVVAVVMVFKLAYRVSHGLAPAAAHRATFAARVACVAPCVLAGLIAAASLVNSNGFIIQNALGYSEGLAAGLMLIAVDRYLDGSPRQALVVGFFAGLDRPELWLVWVPFAAWLWWRGKDGGRLVLGLVLLTPALWFLPELWGSGHLFRGVSRAHHPSPGTAAFTNCPLCTVLQHEAWPTLMRRVKFPAMLALLVAAGSLWRNRARWRDSRVRPALRARAWLLALGGAGLLWWLGIATETQAGFAGNSRYLELGTALVAIAGGVAWGWTAVASARVLGWATRRSPSAALPVAAGSVLSAVTLLAAPPWIGRNVIDLPRVGSALNYQAELRSDLARAITASGGASALRRCGTVMSEGYQVPMVAWMLGVAPAAVQSPPAHLSGAPWPGVILQDRAEEDAALLPAPRQIRAWEHDGARYRLQAHVRTFSVFSTCAHKVTG